jgi:starch phosphorylase
MINKQDIFSYSFDPGFNTSVAYFSMEFAIDQSLKIYSGGLGFLAGSHMRSAYELKQNLIGIGILWKYGYYDQVRNSDGFMKADFIAKSYSYLKDIDITLTVNVHNSPVHIKVYLLTPETFGSAPIFLLSTDIPENDEMSRSITHCLYDSNENTRIAQSIVLGIGGAMLLDNLQIQPQIYHINEGHAIPLNFYLYNKYKSLDEVKKRVVFTTHTPEMAGNEQHNIALLEDMSLFNGLKGQEVRSLLGLDGDIFSYTLAALRFAGKANAVSKMHCSVANEMWSGNLGVGEIISITNAQNKSYWKDTLLDNAINTNSESDIIARKKDMKRELFKTLADQCGKLFDENTLTIVWARRFAGYKRADLLMYDWDRFIKLVSNTDMPVQIIWAGKPYPEDEEGIELFNQIIYKVSPFANCAVLTGYELHLSALLKRGADVWLNNPRMYHEASGTSGMTAAMNGAINLSMPDGWVPEFAKNNENCFIIQPAPRDLPERELDFHECDNMMSVLEDSILPMYYHDKPRWISIIKNAAIDIVPEFESGRMAIEYYQKLYNHQVPGAIS